MSSTKLKLLKEMSQYSGWNPDDKDYYCHDDFKLYVDNEAMKKVFWSHFPGDLFGREIVNHMDVPLIYLIGYVTDVWTSERVEELNSSNIHHNLTYLRFNAEAQMACRILWAASGRKPSDPCLWVKKGLSK